MTDQSQSIVNLIHQAAGSIWGQGDKLKVRVPVGTLSTEQKQVLEEHAVALAEKYQLDDDPLVQVAVELGWCPVQ